MKPTFVVVSGVHHTPVHTRTLVEALHAKGYPTEAVSNPTVGSLATTAPPNADAVNLRQVLEKLVKEQQKDIIILCHSYGGFPTSQSVDGLERSARTKTGEGGGILKVIFLSTVLPPEGKSVRQTMTDAGIIWGDWMEPGVSSRQRSACALIVRRPT